MTPVFPPLLSGCEVPTGVCPFQRAVALAREGCDAGLVTYVRDREVLRAAIVFAPEVALSSAAIMLPVCGIGFQNALGALAPPEVAVHLEWNGTIRINGAPTGRLRMAADGKDPGEVPDWLVVGLEVNIFPPDENSHERTALMLEGCGDVEPVTLLEAWARHSLLWINRWEEDGSPPIIREWRGLAHGIGETIAGQGTFAGLDEDFSMVLRDDTETKLVPLTDLMETVS